MNSGANITYIGTGELIITPGDLLTTGDSNLTELQRTYAIRKDLRENALSDLHAGRRAEGFANLYLTNPPRERKTETHSFFDCLFHGVLEADEGGRGEGFEALQQFSNTASYRNSLTQKYTQPVYRFLYTIRADAPDRGISRELKKPESVKIRDTATGASFSISGSSFYWDLTDLQRDFYGAYSPIRETWTLRTIA
jgi:hypothetical protein